MQRQKQEQEQEQEKKQIPGGNDRKNGNGKSFDAKGAKKSAKFRYVRYARVWASTDRTAGRSWVMACQVSPLSGEQYTWPPVVPK